MKILLFSISSFASAMLCSEDYCNACVLIDNKHAFCKQMEKAQCCKVFNSRNFKGLAESSGDSRLLVMPELTILGDPVSSTHGNVLVFILILTTVLVIPLMIERIFSLIKSRNKK